MPSRPNQRLYRTPQTEPAGFINELMVPVNLVLSYYDWCPYVAGDTFDPMQERYL